jgi:hypothetical protein
MMMMTIAVYGQPVDFAPLVTNIKNDDEHASGFVPATPTACCGCCIQQRVLAQPGFHWQSAKLHGMPFLESHT